MIDHDDEIRNKDKNICHLWKLPFHQYFRFSFYQWRLLWMGFIHRLIFWLFKILGNLSAAVCIIQLCHYTVCWYIQFVFLPHTHMYLLKAQLVLDRKEIYIWTQLRSPHVLKYSLSLLYQCWGMNSTQVKVAPFNYMQKREASVQASCSICSLKPFPSHRRVTIAIQQELFPLSSLFYLTSTRGRLKRAPRPPLILKRDLA